MAQGRIGIFKNERKKSVMTTALDSSREHLALSVISKKKKGEAHKT